MGVSCVQGDWGIFHCSRFRDDSYRVCAALFTFHHLMPFQGVQAKVPSAVDNLEIERIPSTCFCELLFELIFLSVRFMIQYLHQPLL